MVKSLSCGCTNEVVCPRHRKLLNEIQEPVKQVITTGPATAGVKYDGGKLRWSLIPAGTVQEVVHVLEYGARKYSPDNWMKVPDARTRYYDAAQRHLDAWWQGEKTDRETERSHLAHALCCILYLLWFDLNNEEAKDKE